MFVMLTNTCEAILANSKISDKEKNIFKFKAEMMDAIHRFEDLGFVVCIDIYEDNDYPFEGNEFVGYFDDTMTEAWCDNWLYEYFDDIESSVFTKLEDALKYGKKPVLSSKSHHSHTVRGDIKPTGRDKTRTAEAKRISKKVQAKRRAAWARHHEEE